MAAAVKILKHFETPKKVGIYHRLICLTGENKGKAYFLFGNRIVLGRSEEVDIKILDVKSSREHAEIILVGDNYVITDLGSQNGVIVNDLKITQHGLKSGDKVIIGKTVYKFSKIEVKGEVKKKTIDSVDDEEDIAEVEDEEPKNKKLIRILIAIIAGAGILMILSDSDPEIKKIKTEQVNNNSRVDDVFAQQYKKKIKQDKESQKKLSAYLKKGLREFREGNYFRAITEFQGARQYSPNDPLTNFYLRRTKEALNEKIQSFLIKGKRDIKALNYNSAISSYCAVIRLLNENTSQESLKYLITAKEGITTIEQALGYDEGEVECISKVNRKK